MDAAMTLAYADAVKSVKNAGNHANTNLENAFKTTVNEFLRAANDRHIEVVNGEDPEKLLRFITDAVASPGGCHGQHHPSNLLRRLRRFTSAYLAAIKAAN